MNEQDLSRITQVLKLPLPAFYRYYISQCNRDSRFEPLVEEDEVLDDAEIIIGFNEAVRNSRGGWMHDDAPWPASFLIIGALWSEIDSTYADYWTVDTARGSPHVYRYNYCLGTMEREFSSFEEFISARHASYHDELAELDAEEAHAEMQRKKMEAEMTEYFTRKYPGKSHHEVDLAEYFEWLIWKFKNDERNQEGDSSG